MGDIILEIAICIIAAMLVMTMHELSKSIMYLLVRRSDDRPAKGGLAILAVWRYIDPVGLLLAVTRYVPVSRPHLFRIRDKKTNMILGITGFTTLFVIFGLSIAALKTDFLNTFGVLAAGGRLRRVAPLFFQYTAMLSFDMAVANLFPVSTFDMGLIIAGISSRYYLNIIKADSIIKMILILALLTDIIHYACVRLLEIILM